MVVLGHGALALKDLDEHGRLVVLVGGEGLRLLGGDSGAAVDELGHDSADGLNTLGEGSDVEEKDLLVASPPSPRGYRPARRRRTRRPRRG